MIQLQGSQEYVRPSADAPHSNSMNLHMQWKRRHRAAAPDHTPFFCGMTKGWSKETWTKWTVYIACDLSMDVDSLICLSYTIEYIWLYDDVMLSVC